jgi:hypothetical protein
MHVKYHHLSQVNLVVLINL